MSPLLHRLGIIASQKRLVRTFRNEVVADGVLSLNRCSTKLSTRKQNGVLAILQQADSALQRVHLELELLAALNTDGKGEIGRTS